MTSFVCKNCGGTVHINEDMTSATCEFCRVTTPLTPEMQEYVDGIRMEQERVKREQELAKKEQENSIRKKKLEKQRKVKAVWDFIVKNVLKKAAIIMVSLFVLSGVVSAFVYYLDDKNYENRKIEKSKTTYIWPAEKAAKLLPKPVSNYGEISLNDENAFSAEIYQTDETAYDDYIEKCKEMGFSIDAKNSFSYSAFNEQGYSLRISRYDDYDEMDIDLNAPPLRGHIIWPDSGVAAEMPALENMIGEVKYETENAFSAIIVDVTYEQYSAYASKIIEMGVDEYWKENQSFSGKKGDVRINLDYYGYGAMEIYFDREE